jgi:transmembrane sensor
MVDVSEQMAGVPGSLASPALRGADRSRRQVLRSVLVLASAGSLGWLGWRSETSSNLFADFRTAVGERREFRLADGSALLLNTDTAVNLRFDGRQRVLELLRGEIRVTTAVDPLRRPFKVLTRHAEVLALGTRFIVRSDDRGGGVAVLEKAVEVRSAGSLVRLEAGQSLDFDGHSLGAVRRNDASVGAWQQGSIIAINRPLSELLADLSRYRSGVLRCDPRIAQLKVSGAFPIDDTDLALAALESGFSLRITRYSRYWVDVSAPASALPQ